MADGDFSNAARLAAAVHTAGIWWPPGETGVRFAAQVLIALGADTDVAGGYQDEAALRRSRDSWRAKAERYAQNELDRQAEIERLRADMRAAHERVRELNLACGDLAAGRDRLADALGDAERECAALRVNLEQVRIDRDEHRTRLQAAECGRIRRWLRWMPGRVRRPGAVERT